MAGTIALVTSEEDIARGEALRQRRMDAGLTVAALARFALPIKDKKLDRATINRAEDGEASEFTYSRLNREIDRWIERTGKRGTDAPLTVEAETIELDVAGDLNMHITARGPIAKRDELVDSLAKLVAQLRRDADVDKNLD